MTHIRQTSFLNIVSLCFLAGSYLQAQPVSFFQGRTAYPAIGTTALAEGDFTGDGIIDTIVAVPFAVSVYPGHIKGAFGSPITTTLKTSCVSDLLVADFNKDGKLDFACLLSNSFQVALGNGDGTFRAAVTYNFSGVQTLAGADFNGDGFPDLVTFTNTSILVYLGKGDGTFQLPVITPVSAGAFTSIHPGDVNGDGKPDLIATRSNTVAVLAGKGDGSFGIPSITLLAKVLTADSLATGDLNGDGKLDIVVGSNQAAVNLPVAHVAVLLQQPNGSFLPAYYPSQNPVFHLQVADVSGDGLLDVTGTTSYGPPTVTVFEGAAGGTLGETVSYDVPSALFALANPRHKPVPDIVYSDGNTVALLPNQGNGVFVPGVQVNAGASTYPCLTGDFDGDGQPDLACLDSYLITILYGTGVKDQPFGRPTTIRLIGPASSIALGDFNNDWKLDIEAALVDNSMQFIQNDGAGGFIQLAQRSPAGVGLNVLAGGDFNKDGKLDLVTGGGNFLAGNGDGTFQPPVTFYSGTFQYFAVADLNADGKLDLVGIPGGETPPVILLGLGTGKFTFTVLTGVSGSYQPVIADLNADGKPDVVIPAANFGVTILLNSGKGVFVKAPSIFNDFWPPTMSVAVGDFNGDGKPDVVFGIESSSVFPVIGNGDGTFGSTTSGFSVEDSTSLLTLALKGTGSSKPSLAAGSTVITVLEAQ